MSNALSPIVLGRHIKTYRLYPYSLDSAFFYPLIAALLIPPILWVVITAGGQIFDAIPVGEESAPLRDNLWHIILWVGIPSIFLLTAIPTWLKPIIRIDLYVGGIRYNKDSWQWKDIQAIFVVEDVTSITCQFFVNNEKVFDVTHPISQIADLVNFI